MDGGVVRGMGRHSVEQNEVGLFEQRGPLEAGGPLKGALEKGSMVCDGLARGEEQKENVLVGIGAQRMRPDPQVLRGLRKEHLDRGPHAAQKGLAQERVDGRAGTKCLVPESVQHLKGGLPGKEGGQGGSPGGRRRKGSGRRVAHSLTYWNTRKTEDAIPLSEHNVCDLP